MNRTTRAGALVAALAATALTLTACSSDCSRTRARFASETAAM